jgi:hypothetical protein
MRYTFELLADLRRLLGQQSPSRSAGKKIVVEIVRGLGEETAPGTGNDHGVGTRV